MSRFRWADAFALTAGHLRAIHPDEAIFYTSGRTSNEAAFLYQLLARSYGTNNLPDCSNMCHESSGVALSATIGVGKGTVTLDDVHSAKLIVVVGQNPGTNHPRMLGALETAKRRGAKIISINPLPEAGPDALQEPAARRRPRRQGHPARRPAPAHPGRRRPGPLPGHRRPADRLGRARPRLRRHLHRRLRHLARQAAPSPRYATAAQRAWIGGGGRVARPGWSGS